MELKKHISLPTDWPAEFEVLERLGQGGMGTIYKAIYKPLAATFAVKIIRPEQVGALAFKRLINEAKALGLLKHRHIVEVKNVREHGGQIFLAMELLEGKTLADVLDAGPVDPELFKTIFADVANALAFAHSNGIIHRDLKPSNLFITTGSDGSPIIKVFDFGLAKFTDENAQRSTATGALIGTPHYMSPEQCRGENVDELSDIYSLGCVMYEALTGTVPFDADSPIEVMFKHLQESLPRIEDARLLPWAGIICKATEKDRSNRYKSMTDLESAIRYGDNESSQVPKSGRANRKVLPIYLLKVLALTAVLSISVLIIGISVTVLSHKSADTGPVRHYTAADQDKLYARGHQSKEERPWAINELQNSAKNVNSPEKQRAAASLLVAQLLVEDGRVMEAIEALKEARRLERVGKGPTDLITAHLLKAYQNINLPAGVVTSVEDELQYQRNTHQKVTAGRKSFLQTSLVQALEQMGQKTQAQKFKKLMEKENPALAQATSFIVSTEHLIHQRKYAQAAESAANWLAETKTDTKDNFRSRTMARTAIALHHRNIGARQRVIKDYEDKLKIENAFLPDAGDRREDVLLFKLDSLNSLALAYFEAGDLRRAQSCAMEALDECRRNRLNEAGRADEILKQIADLNAKARIKSPG